MGVKVAEIKERSEKRTPIHVNYSRDPKGQNRWYPGYVLEEDGDVVNVHWIDESGFYHSFKVAFGEVPKGSYLWEHPEIPVEFADVKEKLRKVFPDAKPVVARRADWKG